MAFLGRHMSFWDWRSEHRDDLRAEFEQLDPIFKDDTEECEECGGNGVSEGTTCHKCDGDGQVEMSDDELFDEYCREQYNEQRQKDKKKYEAFVRG